MRKIWKNGRLYPEDEAVISIYDSALLYGDSVFEMCRSFNKEIFKLDAHLNRLLDGCKYLDMPCEYNFYQLRAAHEDLINANRKEFGADDEYRTFINISRGPLPIYGEILECRPQVIMTCYPLRWVLKNTSRFYSVGRGAIITSQQAIPSRYLENKVKSHCRMHSRMAEMEARRVDPNAWPLLIDDQGYITESTGANFFLVKRDRLVAPEPRNCLRGISRNYVFSLARGVGLDYRERNIEPFDASTADEAFFTATPFCIMPCMSINGQPIGKGKLGPVTKFLSDKWEEAVNCQWREQAEKWDADSAQSN